ncbi:MAG: hypothetical protein RRC07_09305 [Anaerolineae bacterium]|nr:hypothetical protein [Anaerolineae bacterium]
MTQRISALRWLEQESRALAVRLDRVKPFALQETMVPAAAPSPGAQTAIEHYLVAGRRELRRLIATYLRWLNGPRGQRASLSEAQRRFTFLRLRFNTVLSQFDIFADVMTQRSEYETGVWLGGLDVLAADALNLPRRWYDAPPVICYLDRGHGAAIRRARTRLPGGGENPVAIIRVPRERMISNGIASSLVHEVGHQGAALLDLVPSLQQPLARFQAKADGQGYVWGLFDRWLSEILADCWSVARVGIAATLGLMGVVSLPRAFVFRVSLDDPHPIPWIRVKISCAMGNALYPHPQWERLASMWEGYYPMTGLSRETRRLLLDVESAVPSFVDLLLEHRPDTLHGHSLGEVLGSRDRMPDRLQRLYQQWGGRPRRMRKAAPALVFAVIGQARADGRLTPERESRMLGWLLTYWALRDTVKGSEPCVAQLVPRTQEMMEV